MNFELKRLFCVYKTLLSLLRDRGYQVSDEKITEDVFHNILLVKDNDLDRHNLNFVVHKLHSKEVTLKVIFPDEDGPTSKQIEAYYTECKEQKIQHILIVAQKALSQSANKTITELSSPENNLELFLESELVTNVTEHVFVPKHTLLSSSEKINLLQKYRVSESHLPKIHSSDPVARYYGFKKGDIVKIERSSESAGKYNFYRLVM